MIEIVVFLIIGVIFLITAPSEKRRPEKEKRGCFMANLTEKENYLMTLRGECPEWVPIYTFGDMPGSSHAPASVMCEPLILSNFRFAGGGKDVWGVNYVPTRETGNALLPEPNNFILKDIRQWRDVIKAPDISHVDWKRRRKSSWICLKSTEPSRR